jgi:hypothetical protein
MTFFAAAWISPALPIRPATPNGTGTSVRLRWISFSTSCISSRKL